MRNIHIDAPNLYARFWKVEVGKIKGKSGWGYEQEWCKCHTLLLGKYFVTLLSNQCYHFTLMTEAHDVDEI